MVKWNNLDELKSFQQLRNTEAPDLTKALAGEEGAKRVARYQVPMAAGLSYYYAAKQVNEEILAGLKELAAEAELADKFKELYEGAVINTGEKRRVLHHLVRGQLGEDVIADGVNKREFYLNEQKKITALQRLKKEGKTRQKI